MKKRKRSIRMLLWNAMQQLQLFLYVVIFIKIV